MRSKTCSIRVQSDGTKMVLAGEELMGVIAGKLYLNAAQGTRYSLSGTPGLAFEVNLLELLDKEGVKVIQVAGIETGEAYQVKLSRLLNEARPVAFSTFGGYQPVLPLPEFATHIWLPLPQLNNTTHHTA